MSFYKDGSQWVDALAVGRTSTNAPVTDNRNPTVSDIYYPIGKFWINTSSEEIWYLNNFTQNNGLVQANWVLLAASTILDIAVPFGTSPVFPDSLGTINFTSNDTSVVITGSTNSIDFSAGGGIAASYVTDNGTAVPVAGVLEILGIDVTDNNLNGIQTAGGLVETGATDRVQVQLTNRITGTATTTDGTTPVNVFTFPMGATPGTYLFRNYISVYNLTDSLSASYSSFASVRTTGAAGVQLTAGNFFIDEEGAMSALDISHSVTGNSFTLDVIGLPPNKVIHYVALTDYTFAS